MLKHDRANQGGILADDMGLGKTMQSIAMMRGNPRKTLIVTTVTTVPQWRDALIDFGGYKPIIVQPSCTLGLIPNTTDETVFLTSYSLFQKKTVPACISQESWGRIILDEGHTIRNEKTIQYVNISALDSEVRWVLSGTPIQNSIKDLETLARFIKWVNLGSPITPSSTCL